MESSHSFLGQWPMSDLRRCPKCNAILGWPGIPLNEFEQKFIKLLREDQLIKTDKVLLRMLNEPISRHAFRSRFNTLQLKLKEVNMKILTKPYRLVVLEVITNQKQAI